MARSRPQYRIVWAIDPFEKQGAIHRQAARIAQSITQGQSSEVIPVSIQQLPPDLPVQALRRWKSQFQSFGESAVLEFLKRLGTKWTHAPKVAFEETPSVSARVKTFLRESHRRHADLILITTRRKLGLRKLFDDSFAELVLYEARIPVLVIGPQVNAVKRQLAFILFPTDFGPHSIKIFKQVIDLAGLLHSRIRLFHWVDTRSREFHPIMGRLESTQSRPNAKKEVARKERLAKRWIKMANDIGVEADYQIDEGAGEAANAILAQAKRTKANLVVMQDQSSPTSATLIGSNTRQVVRRSISPVLVLTTGKRDILLPEVMKKAA